MKLILLILLPFALFLKLRKANGHNQRLMQSIKNIGLFLFGVVLIVTGHKVNDAHAQAKADAEAAKTKEVVEKAKAQEAVEKTRATEKAKAAPKKVRTTVEKAKPEKASASK